MCNSVLDLIIISKVLVLHDLHELGSEHGHIGNIVTNAGVVNNIAPEAKAIDDLLIGQLGIALDLSGPESLRA